MITGKFFSQLRKPIEAGWEIFSRVLFAEHLHSIAIKLTGFVGILYAIYKSLFRFTWLISTVN